MAGNRVEPSRPVAAQPKTPAGVVAGRARTPGVEVVGEDEILVSVAVEVAGGHAEGGRALRGGGERSALEAARAVQPHGVAEFVDVEAAGGVESGDQLGERGGGEAFVRLAEERGDAAGDGERIAPAERSPHARLGTRFDRVEDAVAVHVAVEERVGGGHVEVRPPAGGDEILASVPVEVGRREPVPASGEAVEPQIAGRVLEAARLVEEDADAPPFEREGEIGVAVEIDVREQGGGDEAEAGEGAGAGVVRAQHAALVDEEP